MTATKTDTSLDLSAFESSATPDTNAAPATAGDDGKAPATAGKKPAKVAKPADIEQPSTGNAGDTKEAFLDRCQNYGKMYGQGQNSRPAMAIDAVNAAAKVKDVNENSAKEIYNKFQEGIAAAKGIAYSAPDEKSLGVQVSKFKAFLRAAGIPGLDFVDVLDRTVDVMNKLSQMPDNPLGGKSAYDHMLEVARETLTLSKEAKAAVSMTNDQIADLLTPEKDEKSEIDKLAALIKATIKAADFKFGALGGDLMNAYLEKIGEAGQALTAAYRAAGGDIAKITPKPTKEEVKEATTALLNQKLAARILSEAEARNANVPIQH